MLATSQQPLTVASAAQLFRSAREIFKTEDNRFYFLNILFLFSLDQRFFKSFAYAVLFGGIQLNSTAGYHMFVLCML